MKPTNDIQTSSNQISAQTSVPAKQVYTKSLPTNKNASFPIPTNEIPVHPVPTNEIPVNTDLLTNQIPSKPVPIVRSLAMSSTSTSNPIMTASLKTSKITAVPVSRNSIEKNKSVPYNNISEAALSTNQIHDNNPVQADQIQDNNPVQADLALSEHKSPNIKINIKYENTSNLKPNVVNKRIRNAPKVSGVPVMKNNKTVVDDTNNLESDEEIDMVADYLGEVVDNNFTSGAENIGTNDM